MYPETFTNYSGIGIGWRSRVGTNLSHYATSFSKIKKASSNKSPQLWEKVSI